MAEQDHRGVNDGIRKFITPSKVGMTFELVKELESGEMDLAIIPVPLTRMKLRSMDLFDVPSGWLCSPDFHGTERSFSVAELFTLPLILQPASSAVNVHISQMLTLHQLEMPHVISCNSFAALKNLTIAGFGVSPLPLKFCAAELLDGTLKTVDVTPRLEPLRYGAVTHGERSENKFLVNVSQLVREVLRRPLQWG